MMNKTKTLLLCKIASEPGKSFVDSYIKVYKDHTNAKHFITLGSYDALSIYDIHSDTEGNWLESVLADKQAVIGQINSSVSYHPVHLVYSSGLVDAPEESEFPFLFIIFAYGALKQEAELEAYIRKSFPKQVSIYNCINISDRVIMVYSNEITNTLTKISSLELAGYFRKTYTTVSFPMTEKGKVQAFALEKLRDRKAESDQKLAVSIQGTLRSKTKWKSILGAANFNAKDINDSKQKVLNSVLQNPLVYYSFGEEDFTIPAVIDENRLADLLEFFIDMSTGISDACWDIHTELQLLGQIEHNYAEPKDISPVLKNEYNLFQTIFFSQQSTFPRSTDRYPWRYALQELFSAQQKIDIHPLLHGPAYVVYDYFRVMNKYFKSAFPLKTDVPSDECPISDIDGKRIRDVILPRSQESIERSIRSLSQLTDQLTRNDDVLFRGLGRVPAIAATLPENLLEFYHAFLRKLAEFLVDIDVNTGFIDNKNGHHEYEYGFLLAPELNQRMRLSQLFDLELEDQKEDPHPHKVWPYKQTHLIQFPADDIFRPIKCFFPLAHECFHYFGNKLRFRKQRFYYMVLFISAVFVASLDLDSEECEEYFWGTVVQLSQKGENNDEEMYLKRAEDILRKNLDNLISKEGVIKLVQYVAERSARSASYAYSEKIQRKLSESVERFLPKYAESETDGAPYFNTVLAACVHLFKECYADRMAMTVLGVAPAEYLRCYEEELQYFENLPWIEDDSEIVPLAGGLISLCQRIAVVLAVDYNYKKKYRGEIITEVDGETKLLLNRGIYSSTFGTISIGGIIEKCLTSLIDPKAVPLQNQVETNRQYQGVLPVRALDSIVEYLTLVVNYYLSGQTEIFKNTDLDQRRNQWKDDFDFLIRKEEFFSDRFNDIIKENRDRIDKLVKSKD